MVFMDHLNDARPATYEGNLIARMFIAGGWPKIGILGTEWNSINLALVFIAFYAWVMGTESEFIAIWV